MYKIYTTLTLEEKLRCLIKDEDVNKLEAEISNLDKDLFSITLSRIIRVINFNYFNQFFLQELTALNQVHAEKIQPLGFNSNGDSLPDVQERHRQANIFQYMAKGQVRPKMDTPKSIGMGSRPQANSDVSVKSIRKVHDIIINKEKVGVSAVEETKASMSNGSTGDAPVLA